MNGEEFGRPSPRTGAPRIKRGVAERTLEVIHECMEEGLPFEGGGGGKGHLSATTEAAKRLGVARTTLTNRLESMGTEYGMRPDQSRFRPKPKAAPFSIDDLPGDGDPTADELIALLKERHRQRSVHHEAAKLRQIRIGLDGPIGLAFFGDTHVDDPGCAWGDLERDVATCRDTPGILAIGVGDHRNNWIGRLMGLYANQEVTARQTLVLIEWLFTQVPWLLNIGGNHDKWGSDHGDAVEIMHRLKGLAGLYEDDGVRMRLCLPSGVDVTAHVRHDFPGQSQFNGAHAMVRETRFGYRDHILVCGHRHSTAYMPVWHNDPVRLCHGFRCGAYKDFDKYAKTKHFKEENWARALGATIDPEQADNPVRFIKPWFDLQEMAEYLTWRRNKWELAKREAA